MTALLAAFSHIRRVDLAVCVPLNVPMTVAQPSAYLVLLDPYQVLATTCRMWAGKYSVNDISGSTSYCKECNKDLLQERCCKLYLCGAGKYSVSGAPDCTSCAIGKYQGGKGATACDNCAAGSITTHVGSNMCIACEAGKYSASTSSCVDCVAGKYAENAGSTICTDCPSGSHSAGDGAAGCGTCPAGRHSGGAGSNSCVDCDAGKYAHAGAGDCTDCAAGKIASIAGLSTCIDCSPGWYASGGTATCTPCALGYYIGVAGSNTCQVCEAGKYAGVTGSSECTLCELGKIRASAGGSTCTNCNAGSYTAQTGTTQCTQCPLAPLKAIVDPLDALIALPVGMPNRAVHFVQCALLEPILLQAPILARHVQPEHTVLRLSPPDVSNVQRERSRTLKLQYALTVTWGSTNPLLDNLNASSLTPDSKYLPLANLSKTSALQGNIQGQRELVHAVAVLLVPMLQWLAAPSVYRVPLANTKIKLQRVNASPARMERVKAMLVLPPVKYVSQVKLLLLVVQSARYVQLDVTVATP